MAPLLEGTLLSDTVQTQKVHIQAHFCSSGYERLDSGIDYLYTHVSCHLVQITFNNDFIFIKLHKNL